MNNIEEKVKEFRSKYPAQYLGSKGETVETFGIKYYFSTPTRTVNWSEGVPAKFEEEIEDYIRTALQSQLDTFMSCIPEKVEEKEAKFKDDKNGLLSEGYTIGYNEAIKHLLQNLKNKGIV